MPVAWHLRRFSTCGTSTRSARSINPRSIWAAPLFSVRPQKTFLPLGEALREILSQRHRHIMNLIHSNRCALLAGFLSLSLCLSLQAQAPPDNREGADTLATLVEVLSQTDDAQFQLDILKGLVDGLKGRRNVPMPKGWERIEARLIESPNSEVRSQTQILAVTFGSARALEALRRTLKDPAFDLATRRLALETLLSAKDSELPAILQTLLKDSGLRGGALKALAGYDQPTTPQAILEVYGSLNAGEKRDALNTLASRVNYAKSLMAAIASGAVPRKDLSAEIIRQLRSLKNPEIDQRLQDVWGVARDSDVDKRKEIERYKGIYRAGGSQPGDATRGRVVFARVCAQCHSLFDSGGKVGPDLTGSNRADLEYILQNIVDPNAVIPNDYRSSTVETSDERIITGLVTKQEEKSITMVTANETLILPRGEIRLLRPSEISMMPEGLLANLGDQEVRDLVYYLTRPGQVPLPAGPETLDLFFNGKDLSNWDGDFELWRVERGEIVGRSATGLKQNEFLKSQMVLGDFRLICRVKLTPNSENSGIQFRSEVLPDGEVKGYQADIGAGWWGKLYEEQGRGLLWNKSGEQFVRPEDWNLYEVVAVGHQLLTAINGKPCVNLRDASGRVHGMVALQLHAGGPLEVRFKDFHLELNPKPELTRAR
ncbi:MAG: DUF1080 domain-containing protein [Verrucomicrobia bacterium]|nr:DUF1080 domain-containing protein [Verrucomicrobiota bacterium]